MGGIYTMHIRDEKFTGSEMEAVGGFLWTRYGN